MKISNDRLDVAALPAKTLSVGSAKNFAAVKNNFESVALNPQPLPPKTVSSGVAAAVKDLNFAPLNPGGRGVGGGIGGLPGGVNQPGGVNIPGAGGVGAGGLGGLPGRVNLPGGNGALGNGGIPGAGGVGGLGNGGILGGLGGLGGAGGLGGLGGIGTRNGPPGGFKMPGSDRMDGGPNGGPFFRGPLGGGATGGSPSGGADRRTGLDGGGAFFGGTWDFGSKGPQVGGLQGGTTLHADWMPGRGVGPGMKDGVLGVAEGNANGGGVKTPGDTKAGGGKSGGNAGAPEGLNWFDGDHRIKNDGKKGDTAPAEPSKDYNDLGPSTNEPAQTNEPEQKQKDEDTAVAKNDDPKGGGEAGKPNPDAMPGPDDSGGGNPRANPNAMPADDAGGGGNSGPRAVTAISTTSLTAGSSHASVALRASIAVTPNPEDTGGGTPRSLTANVAASVGSLFMPNPEGTGGGTPRSVAANVGALANVAAVARRG